MIPRSPGPRGEIDLMELYAIDLDTEAERTPGIIFREVLIGNS
jgi:hypothetical protein